MVDVVAAPGWAAGQVLRLAAAVDQMSAHVLAVIVRAARDRRLALFEPRDVTEEPGTGIAALVGGRRVRVGKSAGKGRDGEREIEWEAKQWARASLDGAMTVWVHFSLAFGAGEPEANRPSRMKSRI
ncbi:hypothetical protein [Microbispora sp. NPDC046933]|uniref:hypothetical protein n=1 Tax=Microbispora sp. NPDC046933 TaxID=3155618 RepID=UPI0033EC5D64